MRSMRKYCRFYFKPAENVSRSMNLEQEWAKCGALDVVRLQLPVLLLIGYAVYDCGKSQSNNIRKAILPTTVCYSKDTNR